MKKWTRRILISGGAGLAGLIVAPGIVTLFLPHVPEPLQYRSAEPPIETGVPGLAAIGSVGDWKAQRSAILELFENEIFGARPPETTPEVIDRRIVSRDAFGGIGSIEEWTLRILPGESTMSVVVALPSGSGPHPVFLVENFAGNPAILPGYELTPPRVPYPAGCENWVLRIPLSFVFGRHIMGPPVEKLIQRGYGAVLFYPGEVVPDNASTAESFLQALTPPGSEERTGAIAAWAWLYSRVIDVLEGDARIDRDGLIVWGHSRHGKAALLSRAYDERIDFVISHQSGTGGASLNRDKVGESVGSITANYPHWFAPRYGAFAGRESELTLDMHFLIALCAPSPVLLGNADRDQWSDPEGAFAAARAASVVWGWHGKRGLTQETMRGTQLDGGIIFQLRNGRHGVTGGDWELFLTAVEKRGMKK